MTIIIIIAIEEITVMITIVTEATTTPTTSLHH